MPTYEYRCSDCTNEFEIVQKFSDAALTECPECDGDLRKVFSAVGVVFKGSGFYATDNRTKGTSSTAVAKESTKESSGAKGSTSSDTASTAKASKPDKASKTASTTSTPAA